MVLLARSFSYFDIDLGPETTPRVFEVDKCSTFPASSDDVWVVVEAINSSEYLKSGIIEPDRLLFRLAVGQEEAAPFEVDILPAQAEDFSAPTAGIDKETNRVDR